MLWIKKIGYAQLQSVKQKADDWIIIVDESIGIGQEKVLVILGIRRSQVDFTRPLLLQDMEPIRSLELLYMQLQMVVSP